MKVTLSIDEALYYALWYDQPGERHKVTPRIVPPPKPSGEKPAVVPYTGAIDAKPLYIQAIDKKWKEHPSIAKNREKIFRPADSEALGPSVYILANEIVAHDRYRLTSSSPSGESFSTGKWRMHFIVDCGIPVRFMQDYFPMSGKNSEHFSPVLQDGVYVEGLVKLTTYSSSDKLGLSQAVSGTVEEMLVLDLDTANDSFGQVVSVPFGHKLSHDPDVMHIATVFMVLNVQKIGPLTFASFPARDKSCPEPDYPGLVRLEDVEPVKIRTVEFKRPKTE